MRTKLGSVNIKGREKLVELNVDGRILGKVKVKRKVVCVPSLKPYG
jgi:cytoskeletal protein CcmA (bactofilin family)